MHFIDRLIALALEEDFGSAGDVTSDALVPAEASGSGEFIAKEPLVLAGLEVVRRTFGAVDPRLEVFFDHEEGARVAPRRRVGTVRGPLRGILGGERTALNFLQRLSGVATNAARAVEALQGSQLRILDTRKTTPGWRTLEKMAVRAGGAKNHRFGLFDGILIKDNHIAAVGSISEAIRRARAQAHHLLKIECEVVDLPGLEEALAAGADAVLLDNMDTPTMKKAVELVAGRALTEASGGITLARLPEIAEAGVDFVSMGALTHSARAMDISLEILPAAK
ncbi:MAG TPA: carboxylating nicotinate-nucleotide diphosphorylase [Myxococcales bacterium]|nr:carboxylating nicotinate-nucleotide diphosphorylase [Myxococcales bacterium]